MTTRAPTVRSRGARRGFTLLEALVAGAIFFLTVVGVSLLAVQGANNASKGMRYTQAARVATQEMERWAMRGWGGLGWEFDGGIPSPKVIPPYNVTELQDGGGPRYQVAITLYDTSGLPAGPLPDGFPSPNLGASMAGAPVWVPSYWIDVQVTAFIPNSTTGVSVREGTYVSPN
ncbi:MAG: type IV pilus modification PilV family protein [Myxococcaceae bacterium]